MSDEVERTKRVRRKTTPAFINFNYMEETSNLDNKTSEAALVLGWGFFFFSFFLYFLLTFFFHLTGRESKNKPITKNEDMRKITELKK